MRPPASPYRSAGMAVAALALLAAPLAAQSGLNLERPGHWKARYDDGTSARSAVSW